MNVAGALVPAAQAGATAPTHAPLVARGVGKSYGEDEGELNQVIGDISFSLRAESCRRVVCRATTRLCRVN